ncbi:MAG TPA: IS5 family transposase [Usitatibacteraceae bacterium]|nr:IS5 family transposase [Usitatibacteraceae bacterium]
MKQMTLTGSPGFEKYSKATRRAAFFSEKDCVVPWSVLCELIEPHYPKAGNGRPPIGLERMLRIHFLQHWFNFADPAVEEALYDWLAMRTFVGIALGREPVPDESAICKFRHLLEKHHLGDQIVAIVNGQLRRCGMKVSTGTMVDAAIISAPSSTWNESGERDPEMKQRRKGNEWHFGMKAHIGTESKAKLIHHVAVTSANVNDSQVLGKLLHGNEERVYGDSTYSGQKAVTRQLAPAAKDFSQAKAGRYRELTDTERDKTRVKSKVREKVEHAFHVMKRIFGFVKVCYRGLMKNGHRVLTLAALTNLYLARRKLLA